MSDTEKVNILLVDDQPNNLLALDAMLSDLGENLVHASSGLQALRKLLEDDFAVVLLDVQMPELDGFETAALIRERDRSRHTPIIFVTALSRSETNVFKGYSLGAVDYLFKPVVPEILSSKVAVFVELYRKNAEVRRQASDLARLSRQNELILNAAADGVVGTDATGAVTFVNPAAARMLGQPPLALTGMDLHEALHGPDESEGMSCRLRAALQEDSPGDIHDDQFLGSDGGLFPVEYSATSMRGGLIGTVLTFRDVTDRRAAVMASENERLYREAQRASRAKDDFLATLSHELRTPMTSILGWLEILRLGDLDQETIDEALATIWNSARAQAQLIDDMLDVSRIIMGKFEVELRPEDLDAVLAAAIDAVRPAAETKRLTLVYTAAGEPVRTVADARRIRQVIWNLLTNAIKFTEPGGTVRVDLWRGEGRVHLAVQDTGHGIGPEFLPHVFDRLQQAETAKSVGGLGLGLAIARHIIELHGGTIDASSEGIGKGARFELQLPLYEEAAQREELRSGSLS